MSIRYTKSHWTNACAEKRHNNSISEHIRFNSIHIQLGFDFIRLDRLTLLLHSPPWHTRCVFISRIKKCLCFTFDVIKSNKQKHCKIMHTFDTDVNVDWMGVSRSFLLLRSHSLLVKQRLMVVFWFISMTYCSIVLLFWVVLLLKQCGKSHWQYQTIISRNYFRLKLLVFLLILGLAVLIV